MEVTSAIQQADENKKNGQCVSNKVRARAPMEGKIVFNTLNGKSQITVVNSSTGFTPDRLQEFGEMVQILQEEGKLPSNGSVLVSAIGNM